MKATITKVFVITILIVFTLQNSPAGSHSFKALEETVRLEAANKELPMISIILVDESGLVWSYGVGQDVNKPNLVASNDTEYRIGSVSKLFTDITIMQLVENGTLDLDEPVQTYLPDFNPKNPFDAPITLRKLMSHSSGLVREPPVGNYFDPTEPSLAATVQSLNDTKLVYEPGTKIQYSNAGIAVVGRVLEVTTGSSFAQTLEENTLNPLGMSESAFIPNPDILSDLPSAYMWDYQGNRTLAPTFELGMAPAGSMYSTMNDLALFLGALIAGGEGVNGRLLKEDTLDLMWTAQSEGDSARDRAFGIGFVLGMLDDERAVFHGGAIYGFSTQLKVLPDRKIGVAVATNLDMTNAVINRLADHALRTLIASQDNKTAPTLAISAPIPSSKIKKYVGTYKNDEGGFDIQERFGDLYVDRIGSMSLRLREVNDRVVIDDIPSYSEDILFADDGVKVFGKEYQRVEADKPDPVRKQWASLIGEYGDDSNIVYVSERYGQIHVLIEAAFNYSMTEVAEDTFQFPASGLYPNEQIAFERDKQGKIVNLSLEGVNFSRRSVGNIDNGVFQITPVKPVAILEAEALQATPPEEEGEFIKSSLVDITTLSDTIRLDIRYASKNNFLGVPVYSSANAFLQRPAAEALARASEKLKENGFGLLVHDAYRPWYVSKIFWDATPEESKRFVADPSKGSRHNRGAAVDLTLYNLATGEPIEMVGLYDEMTTRSYPYYPGGTSLQRWHRDLLMEAMESENFSVYEFEWWHFDFDGWENYAIQNATFDALD